MLVYKSTVDLLAFSLPEPDQASLCVFWSPSVSEPAFKYRPYRAGEALGQSLHQALNLTCFAFCPVVYNMDPS